MTSPSAGSASQELIAAVREAVEGTPYLVEERPYGFDLTIWGWIHILLGIVVAAAGFTVLLGMMWARVVGIVVASVSLIANFMFIPHYPLWSLLIIALDVAVIWALATYRTELI